MMLDKLYFVKKERRNWDIYNNSGNNNNNKLNDGIFCFCCVCEYRKKEGNNKKNVFFV